MTEKMDKQELSIPGVKDELPARALIRERVSTLLKDSFRLYGFVPLETPALERFDVLSSKYAGGEEILKEVYSLSDQGGRKLGLRYDLTVPLCRVMAQNPDLAKPFKRYQIAPVWRDGPTKVGRYREFTQCDVDTIGVSSMLAEAELVALACFAFKQLGLSVTVKVNNRKFLNGLVESCGVPAEKVSTVVLSVDKLAKIGRAGVEKELFEKGIGKGSAEQLMLLAEEKGSPFELVEKLEKSLSSEEGKNGAQELRDFFSYLSAFGPQQKVVLDPSLARGLAYYTGTVFEVFLENGAITSSLAAGGRYDNMIGDFLGSQEKVPAVGISFGLDVISDALELCGSSQQSPCRAFVIPIGNTSRECAQIASQFRAAGIPCAMDLAGRGISKNLSYCSKQSIPFVVLVGEKELAEGKVKLRDMASGEEKTLSAEQASALLKA